MKTHIDIRVVIANLVNRYYENTAPEILSGIIGKLNKISIGNNIKTEKLLNELKKMMEHSSGNIKVIYADTIAYVEYISGFAGEMVLTRINKKAVALCERRNSDTCSIYCDGFDSSCEMYKSSDEPEDGYIGTCSRFEENDEYDAIEVCSFEEGDPQ